MRAIAQRWLFFISLTLLDLWTDKQKLFKMNTETTNNTRTQQHSKTRQKESPCQTGGFFICTAYACINVGLILEQACDYAVFIDVDLAGGWNFRQTRHNHDCSGDAYQEASTS